MQINAGQSVAWDSVEGAIGYEVELLNAAAGALIQGFEVEGTEIPASVLLSGQSYGNYNVRVRAVDAVGDGAYSSLLPLEFVGLPAPGNVRVE